jgi:hypothetical protein
MLGGGRPMETYDLAHTTAHVNFKKVIRTINRYSYIVITLIKAFIDEPLDLQN